MRIIFMLMLLFTSSITRCQDVGWTMLSGGQYALFTSSHAPFPHPERAAGHAYGDTLFSFEASYNDSSIAVFVPDHFSKTEATDLVFYFHGWGNTIQKSNEMFDLFGQFSASHKNAVFVFPEGPKNASDSFGGKLEEKDDFKQLVADVLAFLQHEKKVNSIIPGNIILAGHSGAYRVIAYILNRGGLSQNIREVYLFDALYADEEKYAHWLDENNGRMVNIVTPNGGTTDNSLDFLENLEDWGIPFKKVTKNEVDLTELSEEQIVFVFTSLRHSEVINPYFELALKSSKLNNANGSE
ncbi:MAG: hypothetical protein HQ508_02930 [Candidatus Marinimicrobia bacterium]|nr:hypothetical protein [Candidatus Neomarinimicrobiota bacterium]